MGWGGRSAPEARWGLPGWGEAVAAVAAAPGGALPGIVSGRQRLGRGRRTKRLRP